jgi:hypothetical protein
MGRLARSGNTLAKALGGDVSTFLDAPIDNGAYVALSSIWVLCDFHRGQRNDKPLTLLASPRLEMRSHFWTRGRESQDARITASCGEISLYRGTVRRRSEQRDDDHPQR